MAKVTTLPELYHPLMEGASIKLDHCAVCGRNQPLNDHHVVKRSQGELYRNGVKVKKPTITVCGFGNNLRDADGIEYCHGKAHQGKLHFRWVKGEAPRIMGGYKYGGHWEVLETEEPTKYQDALEMDGWRPL